MSCRLAQGDHPSDGMRPRRFGRDVTTMQHLGTSMATRMAVDLREGDRRRATLARRTAAAVPDLRDAAEHLASTRRRGIAPRRWLARLGLSGT